MLLRWLVLLLIVWWLSRLVTRAWRSLTRPGHPARQRPGARSAGAATDAHLKHLTQQEISDADYEEIS